MAEQCAKVPREYTEWELGRCLRIAETLLDELGHCVPLRLGPMLDSWAADMRAECEDRAVAGARQERKP
jgi:hypothetical protein